MQFDDENKQPMPTLRDAASLLFRQRWVIGGVFSAVLIILLLFGGFGVRRYEAHMTILVTRQRFDPMVTPKENVPIMVGGEVTEEELNSEVELLRSQDILRKVVLLNGLQGRSANSQKDETSIAAAARELSRNLDIQAVRKTNIIAVKYRSHNARLLEPVLNAVADAYIEKHREVHRASGEFMFFDQQAEQYRKNLEQAHTELAAFTNSTGVVLAEAERDLTLKRVAELEAEADQTRSSIAETTKQIASLQEQMASLKPRITTAIRTAPNPQLMQQLKSTLLNLELKRTELLTKFEPGYPAVQEVESQIRTTETSIANEMSAPPKEETTDVDPTFAAIRTDLAKAEARLSGLKARQVATQQVIYSSRGTARSLATSALLQDDLQQAVKTQEENFQLYSRKREEARISDALDKRGILNVSVAERPFAPQLPAQSPINALAISCLIAGFLSLGSAFVVDFADPTFRTPEEVSGLLQLPVLAALSKSASNGKEHIDSQLPMR